MAHTSNNKLCSAAMIAMGLGSCLFAACYPDFAKTIDPQALSVGTFPLSVNLDGLSRIFVFLLGLLTVAVGLFSQDYLSLLKPRGGLGQYWTALFLFLAAMAGVVLSADAVTFLVFWEIMALSSFALVATENEKHNVQKASLIYLGATRVASALLAAGFLLMHSVSNSWSFGQWNFSDNAATVPALLIFLGLAIKSGIWPFHLWLPYAHPAAPSTVSAIMSGFMIKTPIYAMVRLFFFGHLSSVVLIDTMFVLGMITSFWGVLFAFVQDDLKKLLAYSSVENIGLLVTGLALSLTAHRAGLPAIAGLALVATIFHCINHGLFKTLLFLGVGSVGMQTHSYNLKVLGGLAHKMPWTAVAFFTGCFAICSLPPTNGFAGKWLLYQCLFQTAKHSLDVPTRVISIAALCLLAVVGALTVTTFVKAMGVGFLGRPRTESAGHVKENGPGIKAALILLSAMCVLLGLAATSMVDLIARLLGVSLQSTECVQNGFVYPSAWVAVVMLTLTGTIYFAFLWPKNYRNYLTWDCGYGKVVPRAQVSAESFVQPTARILRPFLKYRNIATLEGLDRRHFPEKVTVKTEITSIMETLVYLPIIRKIEKFSVRLAFLQAGSIHSYLLYVCGTLIVLLVLARI